MAITYGYFDSINGDRKYNADQMSEYFDGIVSDGVFQSVGGALAVSAQSTPDMSVKVASGRAIINNKWIKNDADITLPITAASTAYARITSVVVQLDPANRLIRITTKDGTPSGSPVAPEITENELEIARITVAANATSISGSVIIDKRIYVHGVILESSWGSIGGNIANQADLSNYLGIINSRIDNIIALTPGSTTGDAELADIRVGANGTTYSTAGDAVRGQYTDNKMAIDAAENDIDYILETFQKAKAGDNTFINNFEVNEKESISLTSNNGALRFGSDKIIQIDTTAANYIYSVVDVNEGEIYEYNAIGYGLYNTYVITDKNGYVLDYRGKHTTWAYIYASRDLVVIPPLGAKLYLSSIISAQPGMLKLAKVQSFKRKNIFTEVTNLINKESEDIVNGYYDRTNGSFTSENSYRTTAPIRADEGDLFVFTKPTNIIDRFYMCFWYDEEKSKVMTSTNDVEVSIGTNDVKVKFKHKGALTITYTPTDLASAVCVKNLNEIPLEVNDYGASVTVLPQEISLFGYYNKKCGFLGDSICEGINGGKIKGWATCIQKMNPSFTCWNYGISGACVGSYPNHTLTPVIEQIDDIYSDHPDCDYIILEGGVNDAWGSHPIGTFSEDFDLENWDDTTFTGALEHTFYKAMTYFTSAKIGFIIPCVNNAMADPFLDRAIQVCKKWHIPFIDFRDVIGFYCKIPALQTLYYYGSADTNPQNSTHPNAEGYKKLYAPKIDAWMRSM